MYELYSLLQDFLILDTKIVAYSVFCRHLISYAREGAREPSTDFKIFPMLMLIVRTYTVRTVMYVL